MSNACPAFTLKRIRLITCKKMIRVKLFLDRLLNTWQNSEFDALHVRKTSVPVVRWNHTTWEEVAKRPKTSKQL